MKDIRIFEKCKQCSEPLTLMESITHDRGSSELWLVKRCLKVGCGGHPAEEVVRIS